VSLWNSTLQGGDYLEYLDTIDYDAAPPLVTDPDHPDAPATPCDGHGTQGATGNCTCSVVEAGTANQCASPLYHTGVHAYTGNHCMIGTSPAFATHRASCDVKTTSAVVVEPPSSVRRGGCASEVQGLAEHQVLNQALQAGRTMCHTVCWGCVCLFSRESPVCDTHPRPRL
jgi:hypothetical protein